jgi:hypothetical protein
LQRKTAKDQSDAALKQQQLQIERERIDAQQEAEGMKIAMKARTEQQQREHAHEQAGFTAGVDMYKHREQLSLQERVSQMQATQKEKQQQKPKKGD